MTALEQLRRKPARLELVGSATPRIATVRPRGRSMGAQAVEFARDRLGVDLLPWQAHALKAGLVRAPGGAWASRTVGIMVGRQNGKTRLVTVRALCGMALYGERRILAAAQNRDVALDAWADALELAEEAGLPVHDVCRTNGREAFWLGRARYKVVSATRRGGRGLGADLVILDELREYRDWMGWAALEKTRRARESSQVWAISNEGDESSVVLTALADAGRTAAAARTPTDSAWLEYSAAPELERTDPRAWRQSNPALGYLIPPAVIASEAEHDDPAVFETEVLCRRVASLRPWLPEAAWPAGVSTASVPDGAEVVFALDAGPELRHATIAVGYRRPDSSRVYVEAVAGFEHDAGDVLPRAADRLAELVARWAPLAVLVVARSSSEAAAARAVEGSSSPLVSVGPADLVRAANAFHEAVVARQLDHAADPMTDAHIAAVTADGTLRRRSAAADVDAAYALVLARHGALHPPERPPVQDWVAF